MSLLLMRWLTAAKLQPTAQPAQSPLSMSPSHHLHSYRCSEPRMRPSIVACILFFPSVMDNVTLHNLTIIVLIVTHLTLLPTAETFKNLSEILNFVLSAQQPTLFMPRRPVMHTRRSSLKGFDVSFGFGIILESDNNNNNLLYFCRI